MLEGITGIGNELDSDNEIIFGRMSIGMGTVLTLTEHERGGGGRKDKWYFKNERFFKS